MRAICESDMCAREITTYRYAHQAHVGNDITKARWVGLEFNNN